MSFGGLEGHIGTCPGQHFNVMFPDQAGADRYQWEHRDCKPPPVVMRRQKRRT